MASIVDIEGVGEADVGRLRAAGVGTSERLLQAGASPQGRKELAEKTGISEDRILRWVIHADLFRIAGVGSEYSVLLEKTGVDSVLELAQRTPEALHRSLMAANAGRRLVRRLPSARQVAQWVAEARMLPSVVMH